MVGFRLVRHEWAFCHSRRWHTIHGHHGHHRIIRHHARVHAHHWHLPVHIVRWIVWIRWVEHVIRYRLVTTMIELVLLWVAHAIRLIRPLHSFVVVIIVCLKFFHCIFEITTTHDRFLIDK
jgi:hypothetical protein